MKDKKALENRIKKKKNNKKERGKQKQKQRQSFLTNDLKKNF